MVKLKKLRIKIKMPIMIIPDRSRILFFSSILFFLLE
jgi:hypothetical protein